MRAVLRAALWGTIGIGAAAAGDGTSGALSFTMHEGYIPLEADLMNGTMSVDKAQEVCRGLVECMGFTFAADKETYAAVGPKNFRAHMWLKGTTEWIANPEHMTFLKVMPECQDAKFLRYKRAGHGPYCCEGKGCPLASRHGAIEQRCRLPAMQIFGVPRCAQLNGEPLRNMAPSAKASGSSEYPYAENSGAGAANDGLVDERLYHSQCEQGPQWWRLTWQKPVALNQIVVHNRKDFRARLFGATVRLYAANGTVLASGMLRSARNMYVWTLRPLVREVIRVEVRMSKPDVCLHIKEVEAFGIVDSHVRELSYNELPDPEQPKLRLPEKGRAEAKAGGWRWNPSPGATGATATPQAPSMRSPRHAASETGDPDESAPRPRSPSSAQAVKQSGTGHSSSAWREDYAADDLQAWMATTGSLTTLVLLLVQFLWIKVRWLDLWK